MEQLLIVTGLTEQALALLTTIWVPLLQAQHFFSKKNKGLLPGASWMTPSGKQRFWQTAPRQCAHCASEQDLTIDNILARCMGGTNAKSNLQVLCQACNKIKGELEKELVNKLRDEGFRQHLKHYYTELYLKPRMVAGQLKQEQKKKQREEALAIIAEQRRKGAYAPVFQHEPVRP